MLINKILPNGLYKVSMFKSQLDEPDTLKSLIVY